jgi:hypothetical protein
MLENNWCHRQNPVTTDNHQTYELLLGGVLTETAVRMFVHGPCISSWNAAAAGMWAQPPMQPGSSHRVPAELVLPDTLIPVLQALVTV